MSGIASCRDRSVFAKLFYGKGARRYWERELAGNDAMRRGRVAAPRVLGSGGSGDQLGYVILYEALPAARGLDPRCLDEVVAGALCLARLHDANLVQSDVHVDNFVWSEQTMFLVDADGLRGAHLTWQQFSNLGLFLAQREPIYDREIQQVWEAYARARGSYIERMGSAAQLARLTLRNRRARVRRYLRKVQRECTEFVHRASARFDFVCDRSCWPALQRFMLFPDEYMRAGTPLKLGNSATVVRCTIGDQNFVVKRYNVKSFSHRVRRWFKRRARRAWINGHWLAFLGVETARPVALLETRWSWLVCVLPGHAGLWQRGSGPRPVDARGSL